MQGVCALSPVDSVSSLAVQLSPLSWSLCEASGLLAAHQQLMPGDWCPAHISKLTAVLRKLYARPALMHFSDLTSDGWETLPMAQVLNVVGWSRVLDPFGSPLGGVALQLLQCSPVRVTVNSMDSAVCADSHYDPMQPCFWVNHLAEFGCPDAVVCAPHPALVDLALTLFSRYVPCVCALVPQDYLTNALEARVAWLRALQSAGRVQVVIGTGVHQQSHVQRCVTWVCVFPPEVWRFRMLRAQHCTPDSITYVVT